MENACLTTVSHCWAPRGIFSGGLDYIKERYPLVDILNKCEMSDGDLLVVQQQTSSIP